MANFSLNQKNISNFQLVCNFSTSPLRRDRLWGPPSLLSNGYRGIFPWAKVDGTWNWPLNSV